MALVLLVPLLLQLLLLRASIAVAVVAVAVALAVRCCRRLQEGAHEPAHTRRQPHRPRRVRRHHWARPCLGSSSSRHGPRWGRCCGGSCWIGHLRPERVSFLLFIAAATPLTPTTATSAAAARATGCTTGVAGCPAAAASLRQQLQGTLPFAPFATSCRRPLVAGHAKGRAKTRLMLRRPLGMMSTAAVCPLEQRPHVPVVSAREKGALPVTAVVLRTHGPWP